MKTHKDLKRLVVCDQAKIYKDLPSTLQKNCIILTTRPPILAKGRQKKHQYWHKKFQSIYGVLATRQKFLNTLNLQLVRIVPIVETTQGIFFSLGLKSV